MTESGLGRAGNDSSTAPAFKGLPREIGDGHRLSQIFKKRAREVQRTVYPERILGEFALMITIAKVARCPSDGNPME